MEASGCYIQVQLANADACMHIRPVCLTMGHPTCHLSCHGSIIYGLHRRTVAALAQPDYRNDRKGREQQT